MQRSNICSSVVTTELLTGTTNGNTFYDFVRGCLLPEMLPFDGINLQLLYTSCTAREGPL